MLHFISEVENFPTTKILKLIVSTPVEYVGGSSVFQTSTQRNNNNTINNDDNNNNECGISSYTDRTNLLISNGEETVPGQWPWLVALFAVRKDHEFKCAGSILTTKHIITGKKSKKEIRHY